MKTACGIVPALASVISPDGGFDVHSCVDRAGWVGDCEWAHVHFKPTLSRDQVAALAAMIRNAPRALQLLAMTAEEGECFCCDTVASKEPCTHCQILSLIGGAK